MGSVDYYIYVFIYLYIYKYVNTFACMYVLMRTYLPIEKFNDPGEKRKKE